MVRASTFDPHADIDHGPSPRTQLGITFWGGRELAFRVHMEYAKYSRAEWKDSVAALAQAADAVLESFPQTPSEKKAADRAERDMDTAMRYTKPRAYHAWKEAHENTKAARENQKSAAEKAKASSRAYEEHVRNAEDPKRPGESDKQAAERQEKAKAKIAGGPGVEGSAANVEKSSKELDAANKKFLNALIEEEIAANGYIQCGANAKLWCMSKAHDLCPDDCEEEECECTLVRWNGSEYAPEADEDSDTGDDQEGEEGSEQKAEGGERDGESGEEASAGDQGDGEKMPEGTADTGASDQTKGGGGKGGAGAAAQKPEVSPPQGGGGPEEEASTEKPDDTVTGIASQDSGRPPSKPITPSSSSSATSTGEPGAARDLVGGGAGSSITVSPDGGGHVTPVEAPARPDAPDCKTCADAIAYVNKTGESSDSSTLEAQIACVWAAASRTRADGQLLTEGLERNAEDRRGLLIELLTRCSGVASESTSAQGPVAKPPNVREPRGPSGGSGEVSGTEGQSPDGVLYSWRQYENRRVWFDGPSPPFSKSDCVRKVYEELQRYYADRAQLEHVTRGLLAWAKRVGALSASRVREAEAVVNSPSSHVGSNLHLMESLAWLLLMHCIEAKSVPTLHSSSVAPESSGVTTRGPTALIPCEVVLEKAGNIAHSQARAFYLLQKVVLVPGLVDLFNVTSDLDNLVNESAHSSHARLAEELFEAVLAYCIGYDRYGRKISVGRDGSVSAADSSDSRLANLERRRCMLLWRWLRTLPPCPSTSAQMEEYVKSQKVFGGGHQFCRDTASGLHHPARCYRSVGSVGGPGQQCCYWKNGLVTRHKSAGTPDRVGFAVDIDSNGNCINAEGLSHIWSAHRDKDKVVVYWTYEKMGVGISPSEYFMERPPSRSDYERYVREVAEGTREPFEYAGLDLKLLPESSPPREGS